MGGMDNLWRITDKAAKPPENKRCRRCGRDSGIYDTCDSEECGG